MGKVVKANILILLAGLLMLGLGCSKNNDTPAAKPLLPDEVVETAPPVLKAITRKVNDAIGGYYEGIPARYDLTTKKYPLLIFLPGGGQVGNGQIDLPLLLNDGVMQLLDEKKFPPAFTVNGKAYSFVTLTPQFAYYPSDAEVESFILYALKNYRVDTSRIYLAGLSMGGIISTDMGGEFTSQLAAIVAISGVSANAGMDAKAQHIAQGKLPLWAFHNTGDPVNSVTGTYDFIARIKSYQPAIPPLLTLFDSNAHDAWTRAINPAYKENNLNIYEWMLQYSR
jgi:predicted peptidase